MVWFLLFAIFFIAALLLIPFKEWKRIYPVGIISIIVALSIDIALTSLNAYSYGKTILNIYGIPIFYSLSAFFYGILLLYYKPKNRLLVTPYILVLAIVLTILEEFTIKLGYIKYNNWSAFKSIILDVYGFIVVLWIYEQLEIINDKKH